VGIGSSLAGFSFTAAHAIGTPITLALNGSTAFDTAQQVTAVPEPSNLVLLGSVVLALAGVFWRKGASSSLAFLNSLVRKEVGVVTPPHRLPSFSSPPFSPPTSFSRPLRWRPCRRG
jgi:hypothetical protein